MLINKNESERGIVEPVSNKPLLQYTKPQENAGAQPEILIVDNDPAVTNVLEELLNDEGFVVSSECDGARALALIERHQPNVVLADIMMPNVNGIELCHLIHKRWRQIGVILMSASESPASVNCPFIQKPFDLDDVIATIDRYQFVADQRTG